MKKKKIGFFVMLVLLMATLVFSDRFVPQDQIQNVVLSEGDFVFLPLIRGGVGAPLIGVENEDAAAVDVAPWYQGQVCKVAAQWGLIEQIRGVSDWSSVDDELFCDDLVFISAKGSPGWANGGLSACAPPSPRFWPEAVRHYADLIDRYSPDFLEIWNEPDAPYTSDPGWAIYLGCWGVDYADGQAYAEYFDFVISQLRTLHPDVFYLAGAFLDVRGDFAAGVLDEVTQADGASFHVYEWCQGEWLLPEMIDQLQSLTDLPLYLSETSLIYFAESTFVCEQEQAEYFLTLTREKRIMGFNWYNLARVHNWRNSDMIRLDPFYLKPVYDVYQSFVR